MLISDFAIRRPIITVVAMLALTVFGVIALLRLQTDEFPDVAPPFVSVAIPYPGASPDGVEKEVLDPIEEQIASISGVKKINGRAEDGFGLITIEFLFEKPLAEATQDIRDAISEIRSDLPDEMEEPIIKKLNDTDRPIVSLALTSTRLSPAELTRLADPTITRELRSIPGVAEVTVSGSLERELTIELRPADLQAAGVSVAEVVQALQLQNLSSPVGRVEGRYDERSIRLKGRLEGPEDFERLVVAERGGTLIRLGQLASAKDGTEEQRTLALFNGLEAVGIDIKKSKGYSTTDVASKILDRVGGLERTLPAATTLEVVRNAGTRVTAAVRNVEEALIEGALLTVLVVFLFLNSWRSTVITGLALPVSVLASFIAVWAFGFTLNTMSLLGLSLAIGILIDDAIVVRENIVRHVEMGKDHFRAAHEGTDEIGLAVAATTFSILAVFVPIAFMSGVGGQWFQPFALTIACSVLVSLFVSFSLDPMLSAYWPDPHVPPEERGWLTRQLDKFNAWFNQLAEGYKGVIGWALDHRLAMVLVAVGTFVGSFTLLGKGLFGLLSVLAGITVMLLVLRRERPWYVKLVGVAAGIAVAAGLLRVSPTWGKVGVGFFPLDDRSEFTIQIETPPGSNLQYTRAKAEEASRIVREHPEVLYTYSTLGGGTSGAVDVGDVYVRMAPKDERSVDAEIFAAGVRREVTRIAGATMAVFTSDFGGGRKQLLLQIKGPDLASINEAAELVRRAVESVPNAVDISLSSKGQKPELNVELDRGLAGSLGVTVGQVAQSLRPAFAGIDAGDWVDPSGETRDVEVRLSPAARQRAEDLRQLPLVVAGPDGRARTLPLGQVARIEQSLGPAVINHLNRDLVVNAEWNVSGRSTGEVMADVLAKVAALQLPAGVTYTSGGDAEQQAEVFGSIFVALGVAIMLMYLILVMQFGSFVDPLAILMSLPLSLIGVMLGLAVTGLTVNIMSLIGVILLAGIVAKNAILLIDFAKWARESDGLSLRDALIQAGAIRLRPILMTTFALIAGMIPVALGQGEGAQFRQPLGVAVIGGTITSTLLTLLVIPTVYEILDELRHWLIARFRRVVPAAGGTAVPAPAGAE
ncbi:MAG: efflux RND transporter permease subunit [Gemmatimonadota bacterium]|nr:efflux RND transporter permease subunit [Gemmatimonadota bacterium]